MNADGFGGLDEHSPLSGIDEFLVHQTAHPVRVMWTSDPQAYERVWFTAQDLSGELLLVTGMGIYPNLGTAEAFAIVNHRGRHTTVRAHRRLGNDRTNLRVGPLSFEIVEPFRQWRLRLDENAFGVAYDLRWHDTTRATYRNLGAGAVIDGRAFSGVAGYDGFGVQSGTVQVDGADLALDVTTHRGTRDHHWGVRDGVGGPALYRGGQHPLSGLYADFDDWALWVDHLPLRLGDPRPGSRTAGRVAYRLVFEEGTDLIFAGEIDVEIGRDREVRTLRFERIGNQFAFLRCGMYGGPNGGTPDGDVWMGMDVGGGELVVTGETYDVTDPAVRTRIRGLDQALVRVTDHEGRTAPAIFECYSPLCRQVAGYGRMGISLLDP